MFLSDLLYEDLFRYGYSEIQVFYRSQWVNYLLIASMTVFGLLISEAKITKVVLASLAVPTTYFLLSNSLVWLGNGGYQRPKSMSGFIQTLVDGIPFYQNIILGTIVFGDSIFGGYCLLKSPKTKQIPHQVTILRAFLLQ